MPAHLNTILKHIKLLLDSSWVTVASKTVSQQHGKGLFLSSYSSLFWGRGSSRNDLKNSSLAPPCLGLGFFDFSCNQREMELLKTFLYFNFLYLQVLIVLAWAGLATCAPQRFRTGGQSSSDIVNTVLSRLDIQGAVASALRGQGAGAVSTFSSPAVVATYGRPALATVSRPAVTTVSRPAVTTVSRPAVTAVSRPAVTTVSRPAITNFQLPRPINSVTTVTRPVSVSFTSQG